MAEQKHSLIELQDQVLDYLLRYREENEPGLRFLLRKFNTNQMLEKGHWFPSSEEDGYFTLKFWSDPSPLDLRIFEDGRIGFFYDEQTVTLAPPDKRPKRLQKAFNTLREFAITEEGLLKIYRVKWYAGEGLTPIGDFLRGSEREKINTLIRNGDAWVYNSRASNEKDTFGLIEESEFNLMLQNVLEFRKKRQSAVLFPPIKPSMPKRGEMPIALESLIVSHFQGIKHTELTGLPRAPFIFLTGNNGYGKSSVLRAIFVGLFGRYDGSNALAEEGSSIALRYWNHTDAYINNLGASDRPLKHIAAYGASRLSITSDKSQNEIATKNTPSYNLFNTDGVLFSIENELRIWFHEDKSRYKAVTECLCQIMPGIQKIEYDKASRQIRYVEESPDSKAGFQPLGLDKLASGYKSIIAIIGDMIIRFFQANPALEKPSSIEGVVVIDELDLHLHPIWQRKLPTLLATAFPKVQFIVSTHSPIPILGAPKGSVILTVDRTKEEGIILKRLEIEIENLTPNLILSSQVFGFHEQVPESNSNLLAMRTEDNIPEKNFQDEIRKRLLKYAETQGEYPKDLFRKQQR